MAYMTHLEMIDKAFEGVVAQGCASTSASGACAYLGNGGAKCGIGHLLANDDICKRWDSNYITADYLKSIFSFRACDVVEHAQIIADLEESGIPNTIDTIGLMIEIQKAHDHFANPSHLNLINYIESFKLNMETLRSKYSPENALEMGK